MQRTDSPRRRRLMYQRLVFTRSRSFARRTERLSISMRVVSVDPSSAPRTSLDPADTTQTQRTRKRSVSSVPPSAAVTDGRGTSGEAQRKTKVARLSTLKSVPRVGSILWVDSAELRWTHNKIQRLITCRRRLGDVVTDSHRGQAPSV